LNSDALVIFPWDRHILTSDGWQLHPELASAIRAQDESSLKG
jgi:hypothetical protein